MVPAYSRVIKSCQIPDKDKSENTFISYVWSIVDQSKYKE